MLAQRLKNVSAIEYEVDDEGWVRAFLGLFDSYQSEPDTNCLDEYNNFWNVIVNKQNAKGHKLNRDGFKQFVEIQRSKGASR